MKVRDVMTSPAITSSIDASAAQVAQSLVRHAISGAPIVDREGCIVGLVTEGDLVAVETHGKCLNVTPVEEVMTRAVDVAALDDDVEAAAERLVQFGYRLMPVVEGGRVVGVVSRRDLLRHCDVADREVNRTVAAAIDEIASSSDITFAVSAGVVTLAGEVPTGGHRRELHDKVARIDGVLAVDDRLSTLY